MKLNEILLLAAVALATTVSSRAGLESDATEYGNKLANDLFEHGEKNQEAIYTREVTGANMYGYHSQNDIDSFVEIASHVAHAKGAELNKRELKALKDKDLLMKAVYAATDVESNARNAIQSANRQEYNAQSAAFQQNEFAKINADPAHYVPSFMPSQSDNTPLYPLGIMDAYDTFIKAYDGGTMTAQQVYDATMKAIADKTTVQAPPPEPIGTPFVETPAMKAQTRAWTENAKKTAALTDQDAYKANIKSGKWHAFKNGE
jgi:hypothetical protein